MLAVYASRTGSARRITLLAVKWGFEKSAPAWRSVTTEVADQSDFRCSARTFRQLFSDKNYNLNHWQVHCHEEFCVIDMR